jgi:hypothetical protein
VEEKRNIIQRLLRSYRSLPQKKQYVEFFTAILTIPVLLTVIILNISNLRKDETAKSKPTETKQIVITVPTERSSQTEKNDISLTPSLTPTNSICKKEIGPIEIVIPKEKETVSENPVDVVIQYEIGEYCAVVWSYRINNGKWSDYDDKSIAIYNPPKGEITLELRVKSVASSEEKTITRKFTYQPQDEQPTATQSASF